MDRYKITFETWDKVASLYQDSFMDIHLYDDTYNTFCQLIKMKSPKILEIGCGPGNITKYILSQRPDFEIKAIDVSPNMIKLAKKNNPTADFEVMDCREIDMLMEKFDAIMCGFCMPYLSKEDCAKFIKDCSLLLKGNGILYLSTIEGDYNKSGFETSSSGQDKAYVYYHQEKYLRKKLNENNFELIELVRKEYVKGEINSIHIIFIAKKK